MRLGIQISIVLTFAVLAYGLALVAPDAFGMREETAYLLGGGAFLALSLLYIMLSNGSALRDMDEQMANARHDIVEMSQTINGLMDEIDGLSTRLGGDGKSKELVAEIKVLQTLLAQVAAKKGRAVGTAAPAPTASKEQNGADIEPAPAGNGAGDGLGEAPSVEARDVFGDRPKAGEIYDIMRNALEDNRVDLYLQPIVSLPSRRTVHYECYSRVRDEGGRVVYPIDYLPVAEESGLSGTLDNLLLFRCIQVVRRLGPRRPGVRFFCNISSASLQDEEFFPQFIEFMRANKSLAERMVFEFSQADVATMDDRVQQDLMRLGEEGYRFSMDQVRDLAIDIPALAQRYFSFIKIDGDLLLAGPGDASVEDFRAAAARFDIGLIASKIEQERSVLEALDRNIDFGQGFLFGEPKPSRDGRLNA